MTEAVTAALTQLTIDRSLQVSPSTVVTARHIATAEDARRFLSANLVLAGQVERIGDAWRLNWNLEAAVSHRQLRRGTVTVPTAEPLELELRTIDGIVEALGIALKAGAREALRIRDTPVAAAKDAYLRGRGYLQEYDKEENISHAIALFEQARRLDSNYARAYAGLGEAYWRRYEQTKASAWIGEAKETCAKALTLNETLAAAHGCLGTVYFGTGHYEDAVKEFERALENEPTNDDFRRQTARAEEKLGKLADAEKTYREALKLRPHYWANYNVLGSFYVNQGRYPEAAEMYSQVIQLAPDTAFGYTNLGAVYIHLGRYPEALPLEERSVAIRPTATAYSDLATVYFDRRRFLEAAETFEKARQVDEKNYAVWGNLGDAYYWAPGKREQAPAAYRKAIALGEEALNVNSRDATLLGRIAVYYAMLQQRNAALPYLRRALDIAPKDADVRFKAALIHNQFKEDEQTLEWLEKAAESGFSITTIRDVPNFDHLWTYRRFQNLLRNY